MVMETTLFQKFLEESTIDNIRNDACFFIIVIGTRCWAKKNPNYHIWIMGKGRNCIFFLGELKIQDCLIESDRHLFKKASVRSDLNYLISNA